MPDRIPQSCTGGAERQGRHRAGADRRRRIAAWLATALAAAALSATVGWRPRPLLIWNLSDSSPLGLYRVSPAGKLGRGAMVAAWLPPAMRRLAAARHYLPANIPLVKRVGAAEGDRVCATGARIFINGRLAAQRRDKDAAGRVMPWWEGCGRLGRGEIFLLSERGSTSFDGRYIGITRPSLVVGEARLTWPR